MKGIVIDESHIESLCNVTTSLINHLNNKLIDLSNKDEDIFIRYMAFWRLHTLIGVFKGVNNLTNDLMCAGNDLHHSYFENTKAKENNWDTMDLEVNPFFVQDKMDNRPHMIMLKEIESLIMNRYQKEKH